MSQQNQAPTESTSSHPCPQYGDKIHLNLLVIAAERSDQNLEAITTLLDRIGVPYDTLIATEAPLTEAHLWQDNEAFYQGIILTTGNLLYWATQDEQWQSAFDESTWQMLWWYQRRFGIRQLILYAIGGSPEHYGLRLGDMVSTVGTSLPVSLTEAGCDIFDYLNPDNQILVSSAPVYLAEPVDAATVPLLQTSHGQTVAALRRAADGRETLGLTMAQGPGLMHTLLLGYGLVNWVTRGLFLGQRRVYLNIQIDDIFNQNFLWDARTEAAGEQVYRLSGHDGAAIVAWLDRIQAERNGSQITLDFAFNGAGLKPNRADDALAVTLLRHRDRVRWINHGYTHLLLDAATYAESRREIHDNHVVAEELGLRNYERTSMVTADVSGLENDEFLRAARDAGIRQLVSDTSKVNWDNPTPNTGIVHPLQPEILCIPRRPNNLFYDVSTPAEWVSKYNHIYRDYWRRNLSVAEILEQESEMILRYLLNFDIDPIMFHQANLRAYDSRNSLLSHLIDKVLAKYNALYSDVPIVSLSMCAIAAAMRARAASNAAHIDATLTLGEGLSLRADRSVTVAVTGVCMESVSEWYAGQWIAHVPLSQETPLHVPQSNLTGSEPDGALAGGGQIPARHARQFQ